MLGLAALVLGCNPIFREVPPTFARLSDPITEVKPEEGVATLVVARSSGFYDVSLQALTVVLENGQPLGQLVPHSFFLARVPPGRHTVVHAVPEAYGTDSCLGTTQRLEAGKIYVVNVAVMGMGGAVGTGPLKPGVELSKFSHLAIDAQAAKREVEARSDFWQKCIRKAVDQEVEEEKARSPELKAKLALVGHEKLEIPPPP